VRIAHRLWFDDAAGVVPPRFVVSTLVRWFYGSAVSSTTSALEPPSSFDVPTTTVSPRFTVKAVSRSVSARDGCGVAAAGAVAG
jgi:hypothetical protein